MFSARKLFIRILHLNCYVTDELGFDELFLVLNGEKIWPVNHKYTTIKAGRTEISVDLRNLNPDTLLEVEVWDYDYLSSNDLLGTITLLVDEPGGPFTTDMIPNSKETQKAKYALTWEIDFE